MTIDDDAADELLHVGCNLDEHIGGLDAPYRVGAAATIDGDSDGARLLPPYAEAHAFRTRSVEVRLHGRDRAGGNVCLVSLKRLAYLHGCHRTLVLEEHGKPATAR